MYHALIVEDSEGVIEQVQDRLESIGHTCDSAETQDEARKLLADRSYSYVLLDLEIPVRYGRLARIDNGKNLLREIRRTRGYEDVPIVVMTAHGHQSYRLSREVLRLGGADDFVAKPFLDGDQRLERAIADVLRSSGRDRPGAKSHSGLVPDPEPPRPFEAGEMVFSETRVELWGVKICGGSGLMRAILEALRERDSRGRFVALSGEELAQRAGNAMTRQNDIADAVRRLRRRIQRVMLEQANVQCGCQDVVTNDRKYGYSLSRKIVVGDPDEVKSDPNDVRNDAHEVNNDPNNGKNDVRSDPNEVGNDVRKGPNDPKSPSGEVRNLDDRQQWVLAELQVKGEMRKGEVLRGYRKRFSRSKTTLERDLEGLRRRGLIQFDGEKRTGRWRLA